MNDDDDNNYDMPVLTCTDTLTARHDAVIAESHREMAVPRMSWTLLVTSLSAYINISTTYTQQIPPVVRQIFSGQSCIFCMGSKPDHGRLI